MSRDTRANEQAYYTSRIRQLVNLPDSFYIPYNIQEQINNIQEEWAFLASFEQQFSQFHPFFYSCCFAEALKIAENEQKFLFLYLHSPDDPLVSSFCKETLSSELVVHYLNLNFVNWGGLASRGEGLNLASRLGAFTFPFCAVVAPASGDNLAVLQQIEGPVSPDQLVEILRKAIEEQGLAGAKEEENRRIERQKEGQDAHLASFEIDQQMEKFKILRFQDLRAQRQAEPSKAANSDKQKKEETSNQALNEDIEKKKLKNSLKIWLRIKEAKENDAASGSNAQPNNGV